MKQVQAEALGGALQATDKTNKRGLRSRLLSPDQINRHAQFKRWLELFFIQRGYYKITDKAYGELGRESELQQRKTTELMEPASSKEKSTRSEMLRRITTPEIKEIVRKRIAEIISNQGAEELYDKGYIQRAYFIGWKKDQAVRIAVVKELVKFLGNDAREITKNDFQNNGLGGYYIIITEILLIWH